MTRDMDCQHVQEAILDAFEAPGFAAAGAAERRRAIDTHVAGCPSCAAFAARQQTLDARLGALLAPPALRTTFRASLREQIRRETIHSEMTRGWMDALPDILHLTSWGVATLSGVVLLPFDTVAIVGVGTMAAVLTYLLLTAVRDTLEDA